MASLERLLVRVALDQPGNNHPRRHRGRRRQRVLQGTRLNLVTISAAWLGIMAYLILGHIGHEWPENVRLWMGFASIFSLIVLGKHYPWFGWCMLVMIAAAFNGAGRRRR